MVQPINSTQFKTGIIQTYVLIAVHICLAIVNVIPSFYFEYSILIDLLFQVVYVFTYVSVLKLVGKILSSNHDISNYLNIIIGLELLNSALKILGILGIRFADSASTVITLLLFVFYIIFIVKTLHPQYDKKLEILYLRSFLIVFIIALLVSICAMFWAGFLGFPYLFCLTFIISALPYIWIVRYFQQIKGIYADMPSPYQGQGPPPIN